MLLAKMPLGGCERLWKIFADELRIETGPSGVIAGINVQGPCRYDWYESGVMDITDKTVIGKFHALIE